MIDKIKQQEHASPDSPFWVNREAPAYTRLDQLLTSKEKHNFSLADTNTKVIEVLHVKSGKYTHFLLQELHEVSPLIAETLTYVFSNPGPLKTQIFSSFLNVVWQHSTSPGVIMASTTISHEDIYATELYEVTKLNNKGNAVYSHIASYSLRFDKELVSTNRVQLEMSDPRYGKNPERIIRGASINPTKGPLRLVKAQLLEQYYPGFMERFKIAQSMGLTPVEMATFAKDTSYENSATPLSIGEYSLPDL